MTSDSYFFIITIIIIYYTSVYIYIYNEVLVFVFFAVNAKTTEELTPTLRNYEDLSDECPLRFEIDRLSALGKIS